MNVIRFLLLSILVFLIAWTTSYFLTERLAGTHFIILIFLAGPSLFIITLAFKKLLDNSDPKSISSQATGSLFIKLVVFQVLIVFFKLSLSPLPFFDPKILADKCSSAWTFTRQVNACTHSIE